VTRDSDANVRSLSVWHRIGLASVAVAAVALVGGLATGWQPAILLIIPGFVLFPYAADASVIVLYRLGVVSASSANRLGCLHVSAILLAIGVAVLSLVTNSPAVAILLIPSLLLVGYRDEFVSALGNVVGRATPRENASEANTESSEGRVAGNGPGGSERLTRRVLVLTMPLSLIGVLGLLIAATGGDGGILIAVGFGPPLVASVAFLLLRDGPTR
jgi:hypothetical protein